MKKSDQHPEYQYLNILKEVLKEGAWNIDRGTGVRSLSVFGRQPRYDLSKGFPILTTKKVYWKGVIQELYWFISGDSNIKYLVDNNVHIWDDYPYKIYLKQHEIRDTRHGKNTKGHSERSEESVKNKTDSSRNSEVHWTSSPRNDNLLTKEEFIEKIRMSPPAGG